MFEPHPPNFENLYNFSDVQMIFWLSLLVSNFQRSVWECSVHSCSCPCLESSGPVDYIKKSDLQTEFGVFYHHLSPKIMLLKQPGLERNLNLPSPILDQFWTFWFKTRIPMTNIMNWLTLRPWNMRFVKKILSFLRWMGLICQWFCRHPKKKGKNSKRGKIIFSKFSYRFLNPNIFFQFEF